MPGAHDHEFLNGASHLEVKLEGSIYGLERSKAVMRSWIFDHFVHETKRLGIERR
jgi:hypothetical protein